MKNSNKLSALGGLLCLFPAAVAVASAPPEDLIVAMDIAADEVVSSSVTTANSQPGMFDVRTSLGGFVAVEGDDFAVLYTGDVDLLPANDDYDWPLDDHATLSFELTVPTWANSFSFSFNFLSREFPEWLDSQFVDAFEVTVASDGYAGPAALAPSGGPIGVNEALPWTTDPALLDNSGFDADGATGWATAYAPVGGSLLTLTFEVYDEMDGAWDSAVLLDGFEFSADVESEAWVDWEPEASSGDDDDDDAGDDDDSAVGDDDDDDDPVVDGDDDDDDLGPQDDESNEDGPSTDADEASDGEALGCSVGRSAIQLRGSLFVGLAMLPLVMIRRRR